MSEERPGPDEEAAPKLSLCIATYNRARFIGETLSALVRQLEPGVEIVVLDGASPDDTAKVVAQHAARFAAVRYLREPVNSGVDADYDKAVGAARGEYCWLMTDDDVPIPGAVQRVLGAIADGPDLVVVNAETKTPDLARTIDDRLLRLARDRVYRPDEREAFFIDTASMLSFIGAVVVKRSAWLSRDRASYYGSLFVHVGVIFQQPPLGAIRVLADPLIRIRWGNAMWTSRSFEIWMFKWPALIWSLEAYSEAARTAVCPREPWRNLRMLGLHRALGGYSAAQYRAFLANRGTAGYRLLARTIAVIPRAAANVLASLYCVLVARSARRELHDLAHGASSTWVARAAARLFGL